MRDSDSKEPQRNEAQWLNRQPDVLSPCSLRVPTYSCAHVTRAWVRTQVLSARYNVIFLLFFRKYAFYFFLTGKAGGWNVSHSWPCGRRPTEWCGALASLSQLLTLSDTLNSFESQGSLCKGLDRVGQGPNNNLSTASIRETWWKSNLNTVCTRGCNLSVGSSC